ncbi:hypothetical protein AB0N09_30840 [Streptomyces erythrochromogenes]|uniref:hypothetical protein n=1 Tax=Streptomyces erythrochromogenes TaxID=285574 RepID=UPI003430BCCE
MLTETRPAIGIDPAAPTLCPGIRRNRSVRSGLRVLKALADLGAHREHQTADVADPAQITGSHASRLLAALVEEGLAVAGTRRGAYQLTPSGRALAPTASGTAADPYVTALLTCLREDTGLAVAYHQTGWLPGTGAHLLLTAVLSHPNSAGPSTSYGAEAANPDLRRSAAGRIALAFLPRAMATDRLGRPLRLTEDLRRTIEATRVAAARTGAAQAMATAVFQDRMPVATLTAAGPAAEFLDPLRVQETAVLLRRAAQRAALGRP